jgi:AraC-like DNA-binding protein
MRVPNTPPPGLHAHPTRTLFLLDQPALRPFFYMADGYHTRVFGDWKTLLTAARQEPPSTAVLVHADTLLPGSSVWDVLQAAPSLPVLVAIDLTTAQSEGVRLLLKRGVSELIDLPVENSPAALLVRLREAHARPYKRRLEAGLSRYVGGNAVTLIRAAAEVTVDGGLSTDLAGIFGVNERTVGTWCAREGLPAPRRLLVWLRVLLAVSLLEEHGRTWKNAARSSGYVSDNALRRAISGLLGPRVSLAGPKERVWTEAMATFNAELRRHRERLRNPRELAPHAS